MTPLTCQAFSIPYSTQLPPSPSWVSGEDAPDVRRWTLTGLPLCVAAAPIGGDPCPPGGRRFDRRACCLVADKAKKGYSRERTRPKKITESVRGTRTKNDDGERARAKKDNRRCQARLRHATSIDYLINYGVLISKSTVH